MSYGSGGHFKGPSATLVAALQPSWLGLMSSYTQDHETQAGSITHPRKAASGMMVFSTSQRFNTMECSYAMLAK